VTPVRLLFIEAVLKVSPSTGLLVQLPDEVSSADIAAFALALIPLVVPFTAPHSDSSPGLPFDSPLLGLACCVSPWFAAGFPLWRSCFPCR